LTIPDFSDKCFICGGADCATFHGHYTRTAICPLTGFSATDLPVIRFLCHGIGDVKICDHVTFSLLPFQLVPFRSLSLNFMVIAVWIRISRQLSLTRAMDTIEEELNHLSDIANFINISTMISWQFMIQTGLELFCLTDNNMVPPSKFEQLQDTELKLFLETIMHHETQINHHPIRGPDAFALDFYQLQACKTDRCISFLFGWASQHRR
jgi:hypothetical protein